MAETTDTQALRELLREMRDHHRWSNACDIPGCGCATSMLLIRVDEVLAALSPAPGDQYDELARAVDPRGALTEHRALVALAQAQRQDSEDRDEADSASPAPGDTTRTVQCADCQGAGMVALGEHVVTRDMAIDAGDRSLDGQACGIEWGPCDRCGGGGVLDEPPAAPGDTTPSKEALREAFVAGFNAAPGDYYAASLRDNDPNLKFDEWEPLGMPAIGASEAAGSTAASNEKAAGDAWKTWGIIEIAIRNPNVASYMVHWEGRAIKAEELIAEAREACPSVRMQYCFDAPLLTLIQKEVSRGFNRDAEIDRLARDREVLKMEAMHARTQGEADGFQRGWHAALDRVGASISPLVDLVPQSPAAREAQVSGSDSLAHNTPR